METKDYLVLLVENNMDHSFLLKRIIEKHGYPVSLAKDGKEALEWCENNMPNCIFMDLWLPKMDGLEVIRALRNKKLYDNVKIYTVTAHSEINMEKETEGLGVAGCITKPISYVCMAKLLRELTI